MKKTILSFLLVLFIGFLANDLSGQGAYINIGFGYGFSLGSQVMYVNYEEVRNDDTYENVYGTLGKGLNFGAAFGYMFHKNIGFELGMNYLLGGKVEGSDIGDDYSYTSTLSAKMLRINPSLVISSGLDKFEPYAKVGLILGLGSITIEETDEDDFFDYELNSKMKLSGDLAVGLNASLGALYNLNESLALFGELTMVCLSYAPAKGERTEFHYEDDNDEVELDDLDTNQKEYEFLDEIVEDDDPPTSKPTQDLKTKFPFGSIGFNLGLRICF